MTIEKIPPDAWEYFQGREGALERTILELNSAIMINGLTEENGPLPHLLDAKEQLENYGKLLKPSEFMYPPREEEI